MAKHLTRLSYFLILFVAFSSCESNFNFDELAGERDTIDDEGDPVIENPVDDGTREFGLDNSYCYGFSTPDEEIAKIDIEIDYPESYDLSRFLPPVDTQGNQGSCVAWATGYYLKSFQENYQNSQDDLAASTVILSPSFIFNQIKISPCSGSQIADALDLLQVSGTPEWTIMPYNENDCETQPTDLQRSLAEPNRNNYPCQLFRQKIVLQHRACYIPMLFRNGHDNGLDTTRVQKAVDCPDKYR